MRAYTFAFLRDYFSARGIMLSRTKGKRGYVLTNGRKREEFGTLAELSARATCPSPFTERCSYLW